MVTITATFGGWLTRSSITVTVDDDEFDEATTMGDDLEFSQPEGMLVCRPDGVAEFYRYEDNQPVKTGRWSQV